MKTALFPVRSCGGVASDDAHHYLGRFTNQVSVLEEAGEKELFGWIMPAQTNTRLPAPHWVISLRKNCFSFTTSMNGGERSMVPIGGYERV